MGRFDEFQEMMGEFQVVGAANRAVAGEEDDFVEGSFRLLHPPDLIQPHLLRVTTVSNVSNQGHEDALTDSEGVRKTR